MTNPTAVAGFAIGATALVLVLSSWIFAKSLPAYLYLAASLAVPAAIAGMALSVVGVLLRGRSKEVAFAGIAIGMLLLVFIVPMSFTLRGVLK